jgi:dimethylargininase
MPSAAHGKAPTGRVRLTLRKHLHDFHIFVMILRGSKIGGVGLASLYIIERAYPNSVLFRNGIMTRRDVLRALAGGLLCGISRGAADVDPDAKRENLTVQVDDEFAPLRVAIVHDASNAHDLDWDDLNEWHELAISRGQVHPEGGPVTAVKLIQEMQRFRNLLEDFHVRLITPEAVDGVPSQIFTRDPLFVVGRKVFTASLLDEHRAIELDGLQPVLPKLPTAIDLGDEDVVIEGGDVMVLHDGKDVLVGTNLNSNEAGYRALVDALADMDSRVHQIRHNRLHLDCCLAPLPDGSALYHRRGISRRAVSALSKLFRELIPLDPDEAMRSLAANLLWLDRKHVISNERARRTNERLSRMGYTVHALDFTNVTRMWGSFRCATCPIHRG